MVTFEEIVRACWQLLPVSGWMNISEFHAKTPPHLLTLADSQH
jgi:hypothetical protein